MEISDLKIAKVESISVVVDGVDRRFVRESAMGRAFWKDLDGGGPDDELQAKLEDAYKDLWDEYWVSCNWTMENGLYGEY